MSADGFMDTGDMGYWLDGEIVITGRAKDLILHNGRNIWPQDIEWAAEQIEPLRAAMSPPSRSKARMATTTWWCWSNAAWPMPPRWKTCAARWRRVVHHSAGVECSVVLVPPKSLPFTSSGKLSRAGAKQKYLAGEIAENGAAELFWTPPSKPVHGAT